MFAGTLDTRGETQVVNKTRDFLGTPVKMRIALELRTFVAVIRSLRAASALAFIASIAYATSPTTGPAAPPLAAPATPVVAPLPAPPMVTARAWILMDHFSGRILAQERPDERAEPASLTKLMSAYVAFAALADGRMKLTDTATISLATRSRTGRIISRAAGTAVRSTVGPWPG